MKKGETYFQRLKFHAIIIFKMLHPPVASLSRIEKCCKHWKEKNPLAYSPRETLADFYRAYGKNLEAKKEYVELQEMNYLTTRDKLRLAEVLFRLKDYQGVIDTSVPDIDAFPANNQANFYLGKSYSMVGELENALRYLNHMDDKAKGKFCAYWDLGYCYFKLNQLELAKTAYDKALTFLPDSAKLRHDTSVVYEKVGLDSLLVRGDVERAEKELRQALAIDPDHHEAKEILEKILEYKRLTKLQPSSEAQEKPG